MSCYISSTKGKRKKEKETLTIKEQFVRKPQLVEKLEVA